jgi:hypothetical protein
VVLCRKLLLGRQVSPELDMVQVDQEQGTVLVLLLEQAVRVLLD